MGGPGAPVRVGLVYSRSGPLASYGKEYLEGFKAGLDYATKGTNKVGKRAVEVTEVDDAGDPSKNYFTPEAFQASLRSAMERSEEYVWIYAETPRWWSAEGKRVKLPDAYEAAVRSARKGLGAD